MKHSKQSTNAVIGLFILSLAAFLYLNTRPNNYACPDSYHSPSVFPDSTNTKKEAPKQAISIEFL